MAKCFILRMLTTCVVGLLATQVTTGDVVDTVGQRSRQETTEMKKNTEIGEKLPGIRQQAAKSPNDTGRKPQRRRLPRYYGKVGIDDDQRARVYSIQERFDLQIGKLLEQLEALRADRDRQCLAVLTSAQQKQLADLLTRPNSRSSREARLPEVVASE